MNNKLKKYIVTFVALFTILCGSGSVSAYVNNADAGGGKQIDLITVPIK